MVANRISKTNLLMSNIDSVAVGFFMHPVSRCLIILHTWKRDTKGSMCVRANELCNNGNVINELCIIFRQGWVTLSAFYYCL